MAKTRDNISAQKFLDICRDVYNSGGDLNTVVTTSGLKFDTVYQRYNKLGKQLAEKGVTIPPLGTGKTRGRKLDMDALAAEFKAKFAEVGIPQPKLPEVAK